MMSPVLHRRKFRKRRFQKIDDSLSLAFVRLRQCSSTPRSMKFRYRIESFSLDNIERFARLDAAI